jgi:hypothetical protein
VLPKFLLLSSSAFGLTLACYEVGVRRWGAMRLLFGLKPIALKPIAKPE